MGITYHHACFEPVDSNYYFFHLESNIHGLIKRSPGWNKHTLSMFCQQTTDTSVSPYRIKQLISIHAVSQECGAGDNIKKIFFLGKALWDLICVIQFSSHRHI